MEIHFGYHDNVHTLDSERGKIRDETGFSSDLGGFPKSPFFFLLTIFELYLAYTAKMTADFTMLATFLGDRTFSKMSEVLLEIRPAYLLLL